ncbi:MAG: NAD(P)H-dependent oxidoreductase [Candidatus Omnitrophota bacterium]|nr:NAD(P)H-dependent oxidoreductase [Candidatus Omnitrophota bacterium]
MKSVIIYSTYTGNTRKVGDLLADQLKQSQGVDIIELESLDEKSSFFSQAKRAFWHKRAVIQSVNFDLGPFELICLGTPVWAFGPTPAMNTYLDKCFGVEYKRVIVFTTYGSGAGNTRCLNYMEKMMLRKGAAKVSRFSVQQLKVEDREFVLSRIKEALV